MTHVHDIVQSPVFAKQKKKHQKRQIKDLDEAVTAFITDPGIGEMKVGDLQGIRVYKFKLQTQPVLLAYEVMGATLYLYAFSSHENFYRDLKRYLQS